MTKPLAWHMLRKYVEPLLFWKGDTAPTTVPSGNTNPEGSDADPGLITRDSSGRTNATNANLAVNETNGGETITIEMDRLAGAQRQAFDVLWNNQYAALSSE